MTVVLVHHADAVGPQEDPQRPLSAVGHRQAGSLAAWLAGRAFKPAAIWHSGKLRSRQTAEAFLHACNPFAQFQMIRGLSPDDPPEWVRDELAADSRDLLVVGHMPHLARLAHALSPASVEFPLHGLIQFERLADGTWSEVTRQSSTDRA